MVPSRTIARFPLDFRWGTASAAYQVEGHNQNSQWWEFEQRPGAIWGGDRSGLACDWWRQAEQDFERMSQLHQNAHRLSVEWSRIEPEEGRFDSQALARYRNMLGALRDRQIEPMVTLHHFSDPRWFVARGGWETAESIFLFARFAAHVVRELGDLCDLWVTINEPVVYAVQGWQRGIFPPGKREIASTFRVCRHLLLAHGLVYQRIHHLQPQAMVGYAKHVRLFAGLRPGHLLDRLAAGLRRYLFEHIWIMATIDGRLRPPLGYGQPFAPLRASFDFIGINYYTQDRVRFHPDPRLLCGQELFLPGQELSDSGRHGPFSQYWPTGLYQICQEMRRFQRPIFITEHGLPDADDDQRPRWLLAHLHQLWRAIQDGCDVRGYYHWTLVDNFEWAEGWGLRFGLFALDPTSQERRPRPSAALYGAIAAQNGITAELVQHYAPSLLTTLFPHLATPRSA